MERTLANDTPKKIGKTVRLAGWLAAKRDHGQLLFLDLRDRTGIIQLVATGTASGDLRGLSVESCLSVTGRVKKRPDNMVNPDLTTGTVEIEVESFEIFSVAVPLPFEIGKSFKDIEPSIEARETIRFKHRYLDLRSERHQDIIKKRHKLTHGLRETLSKMDFVEIETPILGKSTPEGARDYLVPARTAPGSFYALPQSPQQYKQLLMVAGFERYFQLARCFRDEDTRADRQPEFTQLDLELSFTTPEEIKQLIEQVYSEVIPAIWPKKIISFQAITHAQAIKQYGTDRPDLRTNDHDKDLHFLWITDFPAFEKNQDGSWRAVHHPFTELKQDPPFRGNEIAIQYDLILNGYELGGGSIRITDAKRLTAVFEFLGYSKKEIEQQFGHLLQSFSYGTPPHGGIALGIDRLMMILEENLSIREVIAFPKTADGRDLLMGAPSQVEKSQLDELGISLKKRRKRDG